LGRDSRFFSSKPFNSWIVVSSVHALPLINRSRPLPRDVVVSKVNQPSVTPPASLPSPISVQFEGFVFGAVAASISRICSRPSAVFRFQVNDTRSRQ
jgi:hypothetical protein